MKRSTGSKKGVAGVAMVLLLAFALGGASLAAGAQSEGAGQYPTAGGEASAASGLLPLGGSSLAESHDSRTVAPGVTHTRITRGEESDDDYYTVDVALVATEEEARGIADQLAGEGHEPMVDGTPRPPDAPGDGPLAYRVRVGSFPSEEEAEELKGQLQEAGYEEPNTVYTGEDGAETTGPWVVDVLEIVPEGGGTVSALATGVVPEKETLTEMASRTGAPAAVNAGYFVVEEEDGTPGDLAGISVIDGRLVSEAVNGRTSLLLPGGASGASGASVAVLSSEQDASAADGARRTIDGVNREPGLIRNCGGTGGDEPTELPSHDATCTDESELILFTPEFGPESEPGDGTEVALGPSGAVTEVREERGGEIPPGGAVLSGIGDAADWLRVHAGQGARISVSTEVYADGEPLPLGGDLGVVNGGPRLLEDGKVYINTHAEGFERGDDPGFYYAFGVRRNPRTLAGVKPDGTLLLVTVDGRQPGYSVGASFEESARLMQALGAAQALNLDGGGSTTLTLGGELANRPSDDTGERPIGDAILIAGGGLPETGGPPPGLPTPVSSGHPAKQEAASATAAQQRHRALRYFLTAQVRTVSTPGPRQRDGATSR